MGVLNQRDPDSISLLRTVRDNLDELRQLVTARWGRVPLVTADPTAPADGSAWIRSDLAQFRWRANGLTYPNAGVSLTDAAQSITNITITDITWGTEVSDVDGWTSAASATLTVPTGWSGLYSLSFNGVWSAGPGASNGVQCLINGVATYGYNAQALWNGCTLSFTRALVAADTIKFQVYQNSGAAINIVSRLEVVWLGV